MNNKSSEVQIKPAKGRPMLTWVGKRPLRNVIAYPAQLIEVFGSTNKGNDKQTDIWADWPADYPKGGLLFHGDNKDVLANLLANGFRGKVKLIYIDPPFDSGANYIRQVTLRGINTTKLEAETYTIGEQVQYADIWANDNYLEFMYERLLLIKELMMEDGTLYLQCDYHRSHYLKCIADEIFGIENLIAEIVWQRSDSHNDATYYGVVHDSILVFSKNRAPYFKKIFLPISQKTADNWYRNVEEGTGRRFNLGNLVSPHPRPNLMYEWKGIKPPAMGWRISKERMAKLDAKGLLIIVGKGDRKTLKQKQYLDESKGRLLTTWWDDISQLRGYGSDSEKTDYPTQKPEELVERIIEVSSSFGDIVLDCFIGSGTTAAVAQKMGRCWIGCDINKGAIQTTSKRLSDIIKDQNTTNHVASTPSFLPKEEQIVQPTPAQLSFAVFRVNDYDLQIQHNEAVNLACEHIGITRSKTDTFFDGVLGKRLAKIIPFNHPASPVDLEEIKRELSNRPEEGRDIVVVCLGKELAIDAWIEDWNRLRKQGDFPNKIQVIELRSDPRYGGFFTHQPAQADIKIQRKGEGISVTIESFISPTIVERLKQQAGLLSPQIDDWRAMVDSVMIDTAYNGDVFNVVLADVPEKNSDLIVGKYSLLAPVGETTVAVKITDMLGEEVLVTQKVA